MYPANYFNLFPVIPLRPQVFVAISFAPSFVPRLERVIEPAIRAVAWNGLALVASRVNASNISDSILTSILDGIASDALFFADITTIGFLDGRPVRNSNVLYEVGIAHALRPPEQVLLFRSDDDPMLFDIANVRVNHYDPDRDPVGAIEKVKNAISAALAEHDLTKTRALRQAYGRLDAHAAIMLFRAQISNGEIVPVPSEQSFFRATLRRLLDLEAVTSEIRDVVELSRADPAREVPFDQLGRYVLTPFGLALASKVAGSISGGRDKATLKEIANEVTQDLNARD